MFRPGQVLKVKVELSPEAVGFGRATIVEMYGNRMYLQLKTSRGGKRLLPKGTRLWFVSDSVNNPFNGLWSATIINSKRIGGQVAMECSRPKFESMVQRRKQGRVVFSCPVRIAGDQFKDMQGLATRNISRSGVGIEVSENRAEDFPANHHVDLTIESPQGEISGTARIVQTRFNWLVNKTDVGLELLKLADVSAATLDRLLVSLGGRPRNAPEGKEVPGRSADHIGALSNWLKSSKENVTFVDTRAREASVASVAEEIEEEVDDLPVDE